jgi:hypothetical protein
VATDLVEDGWIPEQLGLEDRELGFGQSVVVGMQPAS